MAYTISAVDLNADSIQVLSKLDGTIFPYDLPVDFTGTWWWLAEDEKGNPVGYAGLQHFPDNRGFLCRVGVLPEHRGMGLQRRFIRARERGARANGMTRTVTCTSPHNSWSGNSLIKCGYKLYTPEYPWGGPGMVYWWRDL